ncbi:hypothetical protein Q5741_11555 [Paenibacillus sp. JX-17]|uniref:DUF2759 domain-containing protein n=1 Tax=Paenibacillus lacisoli TaxID=3064525 RepID=A0ABT9CCR0_9BACL|nr:hypothetical protein [Paenibacillus sp. JX-17]MDO7907052.1 hypothetical protein [Paenibacillus sp. JX-17]
MGIFEVFYTIMMILIIAALIGITVMCFVMGTKLAKGNTHRAFGFGCIGFGFISAAITVWAIYFNFIGPYV